MTPNALFCAMLTRSPTEVLFTSYSKRSTIWRNMLVGFNQRHTDFFVIIDPNLGHDANGGRYAKAQLLTLTEIEREELLSTWREGKQQWYQQNAGIPLRRKAQRAAAHAISKTN